MAHRNTAHTMGTRIRFGSLDFVCTEPAEPVVGATFPRPGSFGPRPRVPPKSTTNLIDHISQLFDVPAMLGTDPTEEHFRTVTYALNAVAFQLRGEEAFGWDKFIGHYLAMYLEGQPELQSGSILCMASLTPGLPTLTTGMPPITRLGRHQRRAPARDPTWECFVCRTTEGTP